MTVQNMTMMDIANPQRIKASNLSMRRFSNSIAKKGYIFIIICVDVGY